MRHSPVPARALGAGLFLLGGQARPVWSHSYCGLHSRLLESRDSRWDDVFRRPRKDLPRREWGRGSHSRTHHLECETSTLKHETMPQMGNTQDLLSIIGKANQLKQGNKLQDQCSRKRHGVISNVPPHQDASRYIWLDKTRVFFLPRGHWRCWHKRRSPTKWTGLQ